ncbi:MAG TPA: tetratricopeptide repeat protein [Permianibacter sp.]|nr:tetratricopeptide repeat protein [Permianibacter sp.]
MLKRSSEYLLLLCLAGCATTAPQQPVVAPAPDAPATAVAAPASASGVSTAANKPATVALALPLQKKMDEAAERLIAGQKDLALALYAEVQQTAPEHVSAWLNAALIKREQKELPAALTLIEQSLQHRPNEPRALTLKGVVLREQGKLQDAKAAYLAAVAADETYAPAHRNLAVLADVYLDEPVLALQHMERYAALVGDDKQVNSWVTELKRRAQGKATGGP